MVCNVLPICNNTITDANMVSLTTETGREREGIARNVDAEIAWKDAMHHKRHRLIGALIPQTDNGLAQT